MSTQIPVRVQGIPCIAEVTTYENVRGSFRHDAPSDWDYHGYVEIEFNLLDRKGYPALWLERKMTRDDRSDIEEIIIKHMRSDD